ncbi:hypothetical protein [Scytonema sp. PRP1]|uniref:hypothetical protein n=1 Tax=Scytonema sp. PRP1 TaxID=3120513 RepID=UPI002FD4A9E0
MGDVLRQPLIHPVRSGGSAITLGGHSAPLPLVIALEGNQNRTMQRLSCNNAFSSCNLKFLFNVTILSGQKLDYVTHCNKLLFLSSSNPKDEQVFQTLEFFSFKKHQHNLEIYVCEGM